jgi:hypothetical protein
MDAAAAGAGLSAADLGGSFASLAAQPLTSFAPAGVSLGANGVGTGSALTGATSLGALTPTGAGGGAAGSGSALGSVGSAAGPASGITPTGSAIAGAGGGSAGAGAPAPLGIAASSPATGDFGAADIATAQNVVNAGAGGGIPESATALAPSGAPGGLTGSLTPAGAPLGQGGIGSDAVAGGTAGAGAPATAVPSAVSAAPPTSNWLETAGKNALTSVEKNPIGSLAGLAGVGGELYSMSKGNKKPEFQAQNEAAAAQMASQGNQLQGYLTTGTLPPGIQAGLNQARDAAISTVKSQYAARGQSGSSSEADAINSINTQVVSNGANIATQLLNQGISESEFASQIYANLMQTSIQQDEKLSNSIANFSGALAKGFSAAA